MKCRKLSKLMVAMLIVLPTTILAQHYEMVKVDGKKAMLIWEYSIPIDDSAPVIMPDEQDVPFLRVNSTTWRPTMKNDTAFWNNLGKQLWGRDCKIEPVPYTRIVDLIHNESLQQVNDEYQAKSEPNENQDNKTNRGMKLSMERLSIFPNPATTYIIIEYALPANAGNSSVSIYNTYGVEVWKLEIKKAKDQVIIDLSSIPSGSYIVTLQSGNQTVASKSLSVTK